MAETLTETTFTEESLPAPPGEPAFSRRLRREALDLFRALPVPSQETEEWRYTDLSALDVGRFRPHVAGRAADNLDGVAPEVQAAVGELGDRAGLLIQHNSETATVHLGPDVAGRGVVFDGLDRAVTAHPDLVEGRLHRLVAADRTKFAALHAAYRTGGTFLYVPRGVAVKVPLQAFTYLDADDAAVFPHTVIVADELAEVTLIDRYASPPLPRALSVGVTEIFAGRGARVRYVSLQEWGPGVTHLAVQRAHLDRDAHLSSLAVSFGGSLSRTEVEAVMAAPGAHSEMLGLYFTDGTQHFDHRSLQDHVAPNCTSDLLYKGSLKDASRAVYSGLIRVHPGAHKTDAFQTNRNIVLSDDAKADSIPNLEIEANDVRCSHAASVGPVDDDVIFYLQSRGIERGDAERLIVKGFFQEVLDRVALEEVRDGVEAAIEDELRGDG
ncbi:MAG TPA: Fe-S cluster assembly protein SufD [Actinomycetota bacterium]|nr:Fe-S cluster assembly protein SufD [Actinomycetota bacterium]